MNISVTGLHFSVGAKQILEDINMDIAHNQFIGIIGPNGSGKSTFLKCLYRVLKPTTGVIQLDAEMLHTMPLKQSAKKIAVVGQHNAYNFDFTVKEIVLMGRAPHKRSMELDDARDEKIALSALEQVNMDSFSNRQFATLSGGEQQRVILARALAQQTPCLILDEPTNHLDIKCQLQLLDMVKSLDMTVVAALHDLNIAAMYCDMLYVLKEGRVVAKGTPANILSQALIKTVYDVDVDIQKNEPTGMLQVLYKPLFYRVKALC